MKESSYHLLISRLDLHVCDDSQSREPGIPRGPAWVGGPSLPAALGMEGSFQDSVRRKKRTLLGYFVGFPYHSLPQVSVLLGQLSVPACQPLGSNRAACEAVRYRGWASSQTSLKQNPQGQSPNSVHFFFSSLVGIADHCYKLSRG